MAFAITVDGAVETVHIAPGAGGPEDPRDLERKVLEEFQKRGREALVTAGGIVGGVAGGLARGAVGGVAGIATGNKDLGKQVPTVTALIHV